MKKIILIGILALALSACSNVSAEQTAEGFLSTSETEYDFGIIAMGDGLVSHPFEVTNAGTEKVSIEKVYTSCGCTTASIQNYTFTMPGHGGDSVVDITVEPGESFIVDVVYDPAAHGPSGVGFAQRSVYLETNSSKTPELELKIQSTVTNK